MAIALTVETGAGIANANTFATLAAAKAYAAERLVILPNDDEKLSAYLVKAKDYLKSLSYQGTKTYPGQTYLPWPRTGLFLDGVVFPSDAVPNDIINAQCQLVVEQVNGIDLKPSKNNNPGIKAETVGPIQTVYATSSRATAPYMPIVEALLEGWVVKRGGGLTADRG